ncbi:MAG TPA: glycosyltransferase, partial [Myxococcales bacterium]|nr:glycosyltransferase [Myxococcales bacterium]
TEPGMRELLTELAANDRVSVLRNATNLGFVATANRGMKASSDGDVLLLNSDTEVFDGFLDRLRAAAHRDERTGIVSALSNNATILSVPAWLKDNPIPPPHDAKSFAALVARSSRREYPEIVTAVGFCMYVKREVLRDVGLFDEEAFGRGFGEENDLCERARKRGYTIRAADDVFVWHKGKASFGDEGRALEATNLQVLERKQPGYLASVNRFIAMNPLAGVQWRIRFALDRERRKRTGSLLFLLHASPWAPTPGGTEYHVVDLVRSLRLPRAVVAYPRHGALAVAEVFDGDIADAAHYEFGLRRAPERYSVHNPEIEAIAVRLVEQFDVRAVHVQHLLNWPIALLTVLAGAGVPVGLSAHDYYAVCPNVNLFDEARGRPCEFDANGRCDVSCIASLDPKVPDPARFVAEHHRAFAEGVSRASFVMFPSRRALEITSRWLDVGAKARVIEHGYDARPITGRLPPGPALRVAIVGEVASALKGRDGYLDLMKRTRSANLAWHVFGANRREGFREAARAACGEGRVLFHDRYERDEIANLLAGEGIDVAVLLPAWHETYSYVLSEVVSAGIPVIVNERGALPERVQRGGYGTVVAGIPDAARLLSRYAADRAELLAATSKVRAARLPGTTQMAEAYRALYAELGFLPGEAIVDRWEADSPSELPDHFRGDVPDGGVDAVLSLEAPKYQASPWYRLFRRIKFLVPRHVRELGRAALVRRERSVVASFDPTNAEKVFFLSGARLLRHGRGAICRIENRGAQVVFAPQPFLAGSARVLRFWLRHGLDGDSYAQIFWNHGADEAFDADRSLRVELHRAPGEWKEYIVPLDNPRFQAVWDPGRMVHQIRLDPISAPGEVEIGRIEFCA